MDILKSVLDICSCIFEWCFGVYSRGEVTRQLEGVALFDAGAKVASTYSGGMKRRLSVTGDRAATVDPFGSSSVCHRVHSCTRGAESRKSVCNSCKSSFLHPKAASCVVPLRSPEAHGAQAAIASVMSPKIVFLDEPTPI